jgi:hypothetical protein
MDDGIYVGRELPGTDGNLPPISTWCALYGEPPGTDLLSAFWVNASFPRLYLAGDPRASLA